MGVCLYTGPWMHTEVLSRRLLKFFGPQDFQTVDAQQIKNGALDFQGDRRPDLLVLPGGYSTELAKQLGQDGFEIIREYLRSGGRGLFICASAYSACNFIWHPPGHPRIAPQQGHLTHPTLDLFPQIEAFGPLPAPADETGPYGHGIESLSDYSGTGDAKVFYVAGPAFKVPAAGHFKTLAHYRRLKGKTDFSAAIVEATYGAGRVILAGPHIEYTTADIAARVGNPRRHVTMLNTPPMVGPVHPAAEFLASSALRFSLSYDPTDAANEVRDGFFNRVVGDLVDLRPRAESPTEGTRTHVLGSIGRRTLRHNMLVHAANKKAPRTVEGF